MDELYEYLKNELARMQANAGTGIVIDTSHAFRLYQLVCFMKQIRAVVNQEDDMWNTLRKIKEERA